MTLRLWISLFWTFLLCILQAQQNGADAAATIPRIRDEMITPTQALESAIICESLVGMQQFNIIQVTPPQYVTLAYLYDRSEDDAATSSTESSYWIGNSTERLVVTFRGSDRIEDALANKNQVPLGPTGRVLTDKMVYTNVTDETALPVETDVLVHRGLNNAVFSAYEDIINTIDPLLKAGTYTSVFFLGHSVGGAQASLFATYYAFHHPITAVYVQTFGQPRCGNYGFKILMESIPNLNVWRLVNQQDVVPRVPFTDYHHAGHLVWKKVLYNATTGEEVETVYPGYFRTIGDATLGYDGIQDISMAVCTKCNEIWEQFLVYHDLTTGVLPWLMEAVGDPTNYFPTEFNRAESLQNTTKTSAPSTDVTEVIV
mmetsp:Transcript_12536/g.20873  ORF Transcript_12536/g.20873 Transcript_12536/m.20873 type:complete len:372 (+) Transcript_12536:127-1242(+)|eukprot:CAMPEP_0119006154 /NCGR_PEP_ID=MMETSP1176-20130426/2140_1 /TAXON_ID=265551 /ORGANISM="Synedropsis recta cf, Strain CCMP1620" /LENGTH=371 /DNA_ID=CAMNT_0006958043 /DNA_START=113 /DNA_END=1228 /DNA_ORIENTATION=+